MDPDRPAPQGHDLISQDDTGSEPEVLVRRSGEDIGLFDSQRIADALVREANIDPDLAAQISREVREFILKRGFRSLSSSLIRGLVDAKLLDLGLEDARSSHARLGVPLYDVDRLIRGSSFETGPLTHGPDGTSLMLAEAIKREYAMVNVFSEQTVNAHLVGDLHILEMGAVDRPYSLTSSIDHIKQFGIRLPEGLASAKPAGHAEVLVSHLVKFSAALQGYLAGPLAWDSLNFAIAPFLEGYSERSIKQLAQMLVFELSAPAVARGGQSMLCDLHLDIEAPAHLRGLPAIGPRGERTGKTYGDYAGQAERFLVALLEAQAEGDGSGRGFLTPRLALHVPAAGLSERAELFELVTRLAIERGGLGIRFDRDDAGTFYRRYGIEAAPEVSEPGAHAHRSSIFQVVSLNLPRVGYLAGSNQLRVFEELTRLMEAAALAHLEKRVFLEKLLALGERGPLAALTIKSGDAPFFRLRAGVHAIALVGLNELCRIVVGSGIHDSSEGAEFALKTLSHLSREAYRLSGKHKVRFRLSGNSAEIVAHRLARLDLRFFGDDAAEFVCGDAALDAAYYTDGPRLSATSAARSIDRIIVEGRFHRFDLIDAGTELWIGSAPQGQYSLNELISRALHESQSEGLVLCPEFTVCFRCGASSRGTHQACASCGSERIDGLAFAGDRYGYTSSWTSGRLAELRDRKRLGPQDL